MLQHLFSRPYGTKRRLNFQTASYAVGYSLPPLTGAKKIVCLSSASRYVYMKADSLFTGNFLSYMSRFHGYIACFCPYINGFHAYMEKFRPYMNDFQAYMSVFNGYMGEFYCYMSGFRRFMDDLHA